MRVTDIYMAFLSFNDFVFTVKKSSVLVVCCAPVFVVMRVLRGAYLLDGGLKS